MLDTGQLDTITTFPRLIDYLRDQLDWQIEEADFDELTYDYTPEELGLKLDGKSGQIEIKQLRPLTPDQSWEIFFLSFPGTRLAVTVLRRILGQLAVKKRASANAAERASWAKEDLLFIASHGESGERQLTFAHFHEDRGHGDLPTLKVLGWDGHNTLRRLSYTHATLKDRLRWPDDPDDVDAWPELWGGAFREKLGQTISTSKVMAEELAALARQIRARANILLEAENEQGPLRKLLAAFKAALIHDLDEDGFADMYAQTIAYGLLAARISRRSGALTADDAALLAPPTNPFLIELFQMFLKAGGRKGGMDFDELGVNNVVELLRNADMERVLVDFDDRNPQEDPVVHFYELFLKEYDAKKRMQRGVFYTPRPVVSFIVRSVDELLRTEFGLADGFADTTTWGEMVERFDDLEIPEGAAPDQAFVQILDPATGTGTFLVEVIDLIHKTMTEKWQGHSKNEIEKLWNDYVPVHLLHRLHGYELMMAPYAIAHMKIGLKLYKTGYRFESNERARVYLTNALEPAQDFSGTLAFAIPALAHEADAVNPIKRDQRFTAVIGNPPYAVVSSNWSDWIRREIEDYKQDLDERRINLDDDFIKFFRACQVNFVRSFIGILGLITNFTYLDGRTHRRMRESLLGTFKTISILNLQGDIKRPHIQASQLGDQNVFDIQQGTAIFLGVARNTQTTVDYSEIIAPRNNKYSVLSSSTYRSMHSESLAPSAPFYYLVSVHKRGVLPGSWAGHKRRVRGWCNF